MHYIEIMENWLKQWKAICYFYDVQLNISLQQDKLLSSPHTPLFRLKKYIFSQVREKTCMHFCTDVYFVTCSNNIIKVL